MCIKRTRYVFETIDLCPLKGVSCGSQLRGDYIILKCMGAVDVSLPKLMTEIRNIAQIALRAYNSCLAGSLQFSFAIFVAGFKSRSSSHDIYYKRPISCPSLHVFGDTDRVIPRGRKCINTAQFLRTYWISDKLWRAVLW